MEGIEELLESRRAALVAGRVAWEAKLESDRLAGEAGAAWARGWQGMVLAGFTEKELRGAGMVPPGEVVVAKRKAKVKRSPVVEGSGRRAAPVAPDGELSGEDEVRMEQVTSYA